MNAGLRKLFRGLYVQKNVELAGFIHHVTDAIARRAVVVHAFQPEDPSVRL
jgi:hypothetical protein